MGRFVFKGAAIPDITLEYQGADAERFLAAVRGQLPFATSKAINDTAKDFQKAETEHIFSIFTVRREQFAQRAVKIKPFASKHKLEAIVSIDPPGGKARADIFAKFETDEQKRPRDGRHLAIPIRARRIKAGIVPKAQRPRALSGKRNVFVLGVRRGRLPPGIYRRARQGLELLYIFKTVVPLPPDLDFIKTVEEVVPKRFPVNFSRAFGFALRTAR